MVDDPKPIDELMFRLKDLANEATVQQFKDRMETLLIFYTYLGQRFRARFPEEYAKWEAEEEETMKKWEAEDAKDV